MPLRNASTTSPVTSTFSSLTAIRASLPNAGRWTNRRSAIRPPRPRAGLDDYDGLRLGALRALLGLELHLRTLGQRLEALTADRAEMHEHVLAAITRSDEPKALRVVEPLHGSGCHTNTSPHPTQE